jgi:hypothetical protein
MNWVVTCFVGCTTSSRSVPHRDLLRRTSSRSIEVQLGAEPSRSISTFLCGTVKVSRTDPNASVTDIF